jgi:hypothetical protein
MERKSCRIVFLCFMAIPFAASASERRLNPLPQGLAQANGLGVSLSLVGRLVGGGNTLFTTAIDVTNSTTTPTQVDFYLDGMDLTLQNVITVNGSIDASGALVAQGVGAMRSRQNAHFDDFIDSLVKANLLPAYIEPNGFIGSVLFVFNGFSKSGQGAATARFANAFGGGTIGVSLKGHELTASEPLSLVAAVRDSRGGPGAQLYPNVFINNTGLTPAGAIGGAITVQVTAYANSSGLAIGTPITLQIGPGQTASVNSVLQALGVPSGENTILIYATVVSGTSAIEGLVSQVDAVTKDGSAFEMSRADF